MNVRASGVIEEGAATGTAPESPGLARQYAMASAVLVPGLLAITALSLGEPTSVRTPALLLGPMFAVLALTTVVFFLMLFARHAAVLTRRAEIEFFRVFDAGLRPPAWVERPAQAFNNLMQTPTVFYAMGALMIHTGLVDSIQLALAWAFAASRCVHAFVLVCWNDVKTRFATALVGFVALGTLLFRFAVQSYPLWQPFG